MLADASVFHAYSGWHCPPLQTEINDGAAILPFTMLSPAHGSRTGRSIIPFPPGLLELRASIASPAVQGSSPLVLTLRSQSGL